MKHLTFVFLILTLFGSCQTAPITTAPAEDWPPYWEGLTSSGTKISLLGSVHLGKKDTYPLAPQIEKAIDDSSEAYLEISSAEMNDPYKALDLFRRYSLLPEGQTLKTKISKELWDKLKAQFAKSNIDLEVYKGFKPWALMLILAGSQNTDQGWDKAYGTESYLQNRYKARGITLGGLETLEQQIQAFDNWPEAEQYKALESDDTLQSSVSLDAMTPTTVKKLLAEMKLETPELYKRLVLLRNQTMAQGILLRASGTKHLLFAVGSAHLIGEQSIPDLLTAQGVIWSHKPRQTP